MSYLPSKRLYLRGLGREISPDELGEFLSSYGKINEVKFVHNYAFVEFELEADACLVYNIYRTTPLLGKDVTIQFARPLRKDIAALQYDLGLKPQGLPRRSNSRGSVSRFPVVVMGISEDVRWQQLKDFGRSSGCLVAYCDLDPSHLTQGFIEYFTKEDAEYAIRTLNGRVLGGRTVQVVDYNEVSTDRRKKLPGSPFPQSQKIAASPSNVNNFCPWDLPRLGRSGYITGGSSPDDQVNGFDSYPFGVRAPLATLPQVELQPQGAPYQYLPQHGGRVDCLNIDFTNPKPQTKNEEYAQFTEYSPMSYRLFADAASASHHDYSNLRSTF